MQIAIIQFYFFILKLAFCYWISQKRLIRLITEQCYKVCMYHNFACMYHNFDFASSSIRLIESYLSGRRQYDSIGQYESMFKDFSIGVPQSSVQGSLFSLFINGLPGLVKNSSVQLFTDDVQMYHVDCVDDMSFAITY